MRISDWSSDVCSSDLYLSAKEARRAARGDGPEPAKLARPEVTSTMQTYLDLHRHAAVRAALLGHPGIALRLMVAHAIGGSHLWRVSTETPRTLKDRVRPSVGESGRAKACNPDTKMHLLDRLHHAKKNKAHT